MGSMERFGDCGGLCGLNFVVVVAGRAKVERGGLTWRVC